MSHNCIDGIKQLLADIENNIKLLNGRVHDFMTYNERMEYYQDIQYNNFHYMRLKTLLDNYSYT